MNKLIISILTLVGAITASAQNFVGSWELFPSYSTPNKIVDTPEYVYTLTGATINNTAPIGGSLAFYDKTTGEIGALNSTNRLNANKVYNVWYAPKEKCLFVIYDDFNIDLLYDDGRTINVPDLKDAAITDNKVVNDVAFAHGKAYLGLQSGLLIIDMAHGAIEESALWGKAITQIAASEKKLLIRTNNQLYFGNQTGSHHNFDKSFIPVGSNYNKGVSNLMYVGNSKIYGVDGVRGYIYHIAEDKAIEEGPFWLQQIDAQKGTQTASTIVPTRNGAMIAVANTLNYMNSDGDFTKIEVAAANGNKAADWEGDGKAPWIADATGFGKYDTTAKQFAIARMKPKGTSGTNVGRIIQHPMTDEFYISTAEQHQNSTVYLLANGKTIYADIYNPVSKQFTKINTSGLPKSLNSFNIVPDDPNKILFSAYGKAAYLVDLTTNTTLNFNSENSTLATVSAATTVTVDSHGNLWTYNIFDEMPVTKALKGGWENTSDKTKWSIIAAPVVGFGHSDRMILDENKSIAIVTGCNGIAAIQMPEPNKPLTSACKTVFLDNSVDSDGSSLGGWIYPALAIDKNGWVWIGNDKGVMYIKDSREIFNPGFAVTRPKVARNDGTSLADYLLTQVEVMCIAVDENNHKWIGTMGSGLYRVNEDGTEILEHLTTENSDIPSNDILAVCPDRNSNDVYIGTANGLSIYHSTTSPAAEDYKNTYAYPNPVTPDYTGYITITNLKANSLVKITDAAGNIIHETMSNGGLALWNGCDASGRRVRSGVYFVFASQTGEDASGAAVTKIVVVN